jgi:hypothetical protein
VPAINPQVAVCAQQPTARDILLRDHRCAEKQPWPPGRSS